MALIKCPECGKEISDQAASCPNCGCPIKKINGDSGEDNSGKKIEISIKKLDVKLNKKIKSILGGVIVCLVILIGVIVYTKTNITLSDEERAVIFSINEFQNSLDVASSISIDEAITAYYDPEYEQLKSNSESTDPTDPFSQEMIICLLKYIGTYGVYVYDMEGNLIISTSSYDGFDDLSWDDVQANFADQPDDIRHFTKDEISSLIKKTKGKNIKTKHNLKKHSDKDKEELLNRKFDEAVQNDDVSYMNKCINQYAMSDAQKEEFQNKLDKYHYDLGCDLLASGDYEKARNNFKIDNNYDDTETQIKKSYYEEAQANSNNYDTDKIIELYQKADDYSNAKDLVEAAKTYKVYSANVDKLQSEEVTLDDLKNLLPFFEEYKDFANCQKICEYIYEMEESPYLGKWELVKQSGKELHDVEKYINITPYWDGDNDHFRLTFSDSLDDFDPTSRSCQSNGIKTIGTSDDSADVVVNDDGTLTIETSVRGFAFGKGMSTSYYDYTYQKVD